MHKNFVKDHVQLAFKGTYLYGSRARIKEVFLPTLFKNKKGNLNALSKGVKSRTKGFYSPVLSKFYYKEIYDLPEKFRGCNVSFWKSDFIAANGYNEDIKGWGREDS